MQHHDQPAVETPTTHYAPWLMLAGVLGMSLALAGFMAPVLSCLVLVGVGADADILRRARMFTDLGAERIALPVRAFHAMLYAALYCFAWGAMLDMAETPQTQWLLTGDLALSVVILTLRARSSLG